ncbi:MAG: CopG family transcriptional regulator [Sedimenticola sp.]|nr:MAG: CopG family transcriptional regulator [Sedimenticola sp.]
MKLAAALLTGLALIVGGILINQQPSRAADIVVYKSPTCGCCKSWIEHLEANGFSVETHDRTNMSPVKAEFGVPTDLQSCHTAKVGDYVIEGHVPADLITRLLEEKPKVMGLAVPGMPMGSPGMEGNRKDPYDVVTFQANGSSRVYAKR